MVQSVLGLYKQCNIYYLCSNILPPCLFAHAERCICHCMNSPTINAYSSWAYWNTEFSFNHYVLFRKKKLSANKHHMVPGSNEQPSLPKCLTRELDDHTYSRFCQSRHCHEFIEQLEEARVCTEQKIKELEVQLSALIVKKPIMTLGSIKNDAKKVCCFYMCTILA